MAGWIGGVSAYGSNYSAYGTERFYTGRETASLMASVEYKGRAAAQERIFR